MKSSNSEELRNHDLFNVIFLVIIIALDIFYLYQTTDFVKLAEGRVSLEEQSESRLFQLFFAVFSFYLLVDCVWVILIPSCVASDPKAIILHHVATAFAILVPFFLPRFGWHMGACLIVEVNTLCLTIRRNVTKDELLYHILNISFYVTWVILRLLMFPVLTALFALEYYWYSELTSNYFNIVVFAPTFQSLLTLMSYKWTYDLISKQRRKSKEN